MGSKRQDLPPDYVSAREAFRANLRQRDLFLQRLDAPALRWAAGLHRIAYMPALLETVFAKGYDNFPRFEEPSPIIAISHKKIHDILAGIAFLGGRPLHRFHNVTLVAQAALFNGIFAYRDVVPDFLKRSPLLGATAAFSRFAGRWTERMVRSFHAHPVFREGVDLPTEEDYYHDRFAGPRIMGMDYPAFLRFSGRSTMSSVVTVQKEVDELNRSFVIFPEGKYLHDGGVAELQDLAGIVAFRKQRGVVPVSITYDELCPDQWGRITAWLIAGPIIQPPREKKDIPLFLEGLRTVMQSLSVVTGSHLLGAILQAARGQGRNSIGRSELGSQLADCVLAVREAGHGMDPRLESTGFQEERMERFLRSKRRWFMQQGQKGILSFNEKAMGKFASSERTVDDISWNANNIRHVKLPL